MWEQDRNERIAEILGDQYTATAMQLGIDARQHLGGWLHYWRNADSRFLHHTVDPEQIVPVFSEYGNDLVGVLRCLPCSTRRQSDRAGHCEYWDDTTCRISTVKNGVSGKPPTSVSGSQTLGAAARLTRLSTTVCIPFYNNADRRVTCRCTAT